MCKLYGCDYCENNEIHYCRRCGALDDHLTRECRNQGPKMTSDIAVMFKALSNRRTHEPLNQVDAKKASEAYTNDAKKYWYDTSKFAWFTREDIGEHYDYFKQLQMATNKDYGDYVRFEIDDVELLTCERWRVFVHVVLARLKNPRSRCRRGTSCYHNTRGRCYNSHIDV